jgi:hypothetical protein
MFDVVASGPKVEEYDAPAQSYVVGDGETYFDVDDMIGIVDVIGVDELDTIGEDKDNADDGEDMVIVCVLVRVITTLVTRVDVAPNVYVIVVINVNVVVLVLEMGVEDEDDGELESVELGVAFVEGDDNGPSTQML